MYLTPFKLYLLVWMPGLCAGYILEYNVASRVSDSTSALILMPALVYALYGLFHRAERTRKTANKPRYWRSTLELICSQIDKRKALRALSIMVWVWLFFYVVMVFYSGGVPLLWVITGDPRTYVDFGIPTVGGLCNLLRAFSTALAGLMLAHQEVSPRQKKRLWLLIMFFLFTAFGLETGRGNGVVLLLHPIAFFFLGRVLNKATIMSLAFAAPVFLLGLGYIQHIRYGSDWEQTYSYATSQGFEVNESPIVTLLVPAVTYTVSPVQNLNLTVAEAQAFSIKPYYSIQSLLPTVIRDKIFEQQDYGHLVSEANNVTSSFTPLVRDFGLLGAGIAGLLISIITGWSWLQATRGKLYWALLWPALFMTIALSFFNLFFTSLVVVLYAPLAWLVATKIRRSAN